MSNEKKEGTPTSDVRARWERPSLKFVGNVNEIFLFPGSGKVSTASYDTGDTPFKPKGLEPNP
jgi:hypothetical protein